MTEANFNCRFLAAACMVFASACGGGDDDAKNQPGVEERAERAAATAGDALEDASEATVEAAEGAVDTISTAIDKELDDVNALGLTVRNLLNENVLTRKGSVAAQIEDLLFTEDGRLTLVQLKEGGIFGAGEDFVMVVPQRLVITMTNEKEPVVEISLTEEEIEQLGDSTSFLPADFSVGGSIATNLISGRKLLDSIVLNTENEKAADIYDLLLGIEWNINSVVISRGGLGEIGDRLSVAPIDRFVMTEDRSAMQTTMSTPTFDAMPTFSYDAFAE
ncbi:MAG: hypothetical protein AAGD92_06540 [Pseudomonadota bacterium]